MQESQPQKIDLFPKIYRFITEQGTIMVVSFVSGVVIIGIILQVTRLKDNLQKITSLKQQRLQIAKELQYWQDLARQHGDYRDAYVKLASLQYQLGEKVQAQKSMEKVLSLDPNFKEGNVLGAKIKAQ